MSMSAEPYLRPIVSVDLAIFALSATGLEILLMRRASEPCADQLALPGGWIHVDEDPDIEAAARRVLLDKTGVATPYLEQLHTVGSAGRDPRGWAVSIVYVALIAADEARLRRGANAADVAWRPVGGDADLPTAFDHADIVRAALTRVRNKVEYSTLPVHLLPAEFTLGELQAVYEQILGRRLDKSAFRKRMAEIDFVEPVPGEMRRASNRPAQVYRVKPGCATILFDRTI